MRVWAKCPTARVPNGAANKAGPVAQHLVPTCRVAGLRARDALAAMPAPIAQARALAYEQVRAQAFAGRPSEFVHGGFYG